MLLNHVKIVEQPIPGGADVAAKRGGGRQARIGVVENAPCGVESCEKSRAAKPCTPEVRPLNACDGARTLGEMLRA